MANRKSLLTAPYQVTVVFCSEGVSVRTFIRTYFTEPAANFIGEEFNCAPLNYDFS